MPLFQQIIRLSGPEEGLEGTQSCKFLGVLSYPMAHYKICIFVRVYLHLHISRISNEISR